MKKITNCILTLATTIALTSANIASTPAQKTGYEPFTKHTVVTSNNSSMAAGRISKIKKLKYGRKVFVICYDNEYDGHEYTIVLSGQEMKSWERDQGKIKKGMKATVMLYKCNTATVEDDVIVNIRKGWY